jgi:hypothetical protein
LDNSSLRFAMTRLFQTTTLLSKPATPRRRKLGRWLAGLFLFYTILGFFILPPIIRAVVARQISRQLNREVSIQKVRLNPFALSITIRGLMIKDKDGQPFVSWDELYVNFQLSSFFGRAWVFKEVRRSDRVGGAEQLSGRRE